MYRDPVAADLEKLASEEKWAETDEMAAAEVDFVQSTSAPVEVDSGVKPVSFDLPAEVDSINVECDATKIKVSVFYFIHWVSNFERR